jgi:flagellar motor switch protein FliN/FliY
MKENISLERNTNATRLERRQKVEVNTIEFGEFGKKEVKNNDLGIEFIPKLKMDIRVELSKTKIKAKDVLELKPGKVIKLDAIAGDHVDVLLNSERIAKGEVLVLDGSYGIRISSMRKKNKEK